MSFPLFKMKIQVVNVNMKHGTIYVVFLAISEVVICVDYIRSDILMIPKC